MKAAEALKIVQEAGVTVHIDGDDLVLSAPVAPPTSLLDALNLLKPEIVALLRLEQAESTEEDWQAFYDERADFLEFDGGQGRAEAEASAFESCISEWLNRHPVPSSPDRCAWCGEMQHSSGTVVPFGEEPHGHTWLHPECWAAWSADRRRLAVEALQKMGIGRTSVGDTDAT